MGKKKKQEHWSKGALLGEGPQSGGRIILGEESNGKGEKVSGEESKGTWALRSWGIALKERNSGSTINISKQRGCD